MNAAYITLRVDSLPTTCIQALAARTMPRDVDD